MSNLTTRIVKLPARQAGPYTLGMNRINLTIPSNMICDLSKSFLELEANINTTGDSGVHNVNLQYGNVKENPVYNVAAVKNCRLSSDQLGNLEETQDVNHLRSNLNHIQLSLSEQNSLSYNSLRQTANRYGQRCGIFRQLNGEGVVSSVEQLGRIPIKLSQLFGMGEIQEVDTSKTGELNIEVELDFNVQGVLMDDFTQYGTTSTGGTASIVLTDNFTARDFPFCVGEGVFFMQNSNATRVGMRTVTGIDVQTKTVTINDALPAALTNVTIQKANWKDANALAGNTDTIVLSDKFQTLSGSPFWVGQTVEVSSGGGFVTQLATATILSIVRGGLGATNPGEVTIVLSAQTTGGNVDRVKIRPIASGVTASLIYESMQLVLHEKMEKSVDHSGGYRIYSYQTEKSNGNNNQLYNGSFNLPSNCINAVLMNKVQNSLYSENDDVDQYRLVLDNNNLTDRPVSIYDSLYFDEVGKWCMNSGKVYTNLRDVPQVRNFNDSIDSPGAELPVVYVGTPIPLTAQNKILQVEVDTVANGLSSINMYKQIEKVINV